MARFSLFARYVDKLWQGLLRSVFSRRLAFVSIVVVLSVQWFTGRLTDSSLVERFAPEAVILWLFVVWHIFKACFLLNREISGEVGSYTPTIIVPGESKRDPPDVVPHFKFKLLAIASLTFISWCLASYLVQNIWQYVSVSQEGRADAKESDMLEAYSDQHFDKNGDPVPGVASRTVTITMFAADVSLKDLIRTECPRIMSFIAYRQQHAPPYPLFGWLSPSAMKMLAPFEAETERQFADQFLVELRVWRDRMAAVGLHDNDLDRALRDPRDITSMRIIVQRTFALSRNLPQKVLASQFLKSR